jgi:hypothetical protein
MINGWNISISTKYGVDKILLDKKLQPELSSELAEDQLWKLEYDDQYAQIWFKISSP